MKKFQEELKRKKIAACLIEDNVKLFYMIGLRVSEGSLIVTPTKAMLFVDGRYTVMAKAHSPVPVGDRSLKAMKAFLKKVSARKLAFDAATTSYQRYKELKKIGPVCGMSGVLDGCRGVKSAREIAKLKKSAALLWKGFGEIQRLLRVGIREEEVARAFEVFCLQNGGERLGFDPIIAFGPNSALPHHRAGNRKLKKNDIVLVDIGVVVDGYHSDMTRVVFFNKPTAKMRKIYELVHGAQQEALAMIRPGVRLGELDEAVRTLFRKAGMLKYYPHGLGHGVGLEVHEYPRVSYQGVNKDLKMEAGMVFTVEPGLYLPKEFGVRYEDTIVVTKNGYENFYPNIPFEGTFILSLPECSLSQS